MQLRSCTWRWLLCLSIIGALTAGTSASAPATEEAKAQNKKPSISLKVSPPVGFTPLRVVVTAELKGGANDYEDFYCASVEWDWGDDTKSETKADCDPYEAGKSEIKRRYVMEHVFRAMSSPLSDPAGTNPNPSIQYRIRFTLKQKNKTVGSGQTTVEIRNGMG
ncbi:MAG TPA: hypothetical protein VH740_23440 [Vicinamibacterales bacterium]|jgi:hypothetical protein